MMRAYDNEIKGWLDDTDFDNKTTKDGNVLLGNTNEDTTMEEESLIVEADSVWNSSHVYGKIIGANFMLPRSDGRVKVIV